MLQMWHLHHFSLVGFFFFFFVSVGLLVCIFYISSLKNILLTDSYSLLIQFSEGCAPNKSLLFHTVYVKEVK